MVKRSDLDSSENRKVVVDSGKFATKAVSRLPDGKLETLYFQTRMNPTDEISTNAEETVVVEFDGQRILLGKMAEKGDSDTSKAKDLHRISTYRAIFEFVKDGDTVELVIGCPLSVYTVRERRVAYENFIKGEGEIKITVNGDTKSFRIVSILVLPESSGYVFKHMEDFVDRITALIDIGGLNANCCQYEGTNIIKGTELTFNLGTNMLRNSLQNYLNKMLPANLSEKQIEHAMTDRHVKKDPKRGRELIDKFMLNHVVELKEFLKKNNWDVDSLDFVFIGGGSLLLQDEVLQVFGDDTVISEDAVWDNVEGFGELVNV